MTPFIFANNIKTTLASAVSSTATTITLASSTDLPSSIPTGYYLPITLNDAATGQVYEIVYATAVSGANLTVLRAQEGTSAGTWAIGDYVFCGPTAGQMTSPTAEIISVLTAAGLTPDRTNTGQLLESLQKYKPLAASNSATGINTSLSASVSFTAPSSGILFAAGSVNYSVQSTQQNTASLAINGNVLASDNTQESKSHSAQVEITSGQTVTASYTAGTNVSFSVWVSLLFVPNPLT